jgi:hypothetical protein
MIEGHEFTCAQKAYPIVSYGSMLNIDSNPSQAALTYLASERVTQASGSKRARDASYTFFFLLHNNIWL